MHILSALIINKQQKQKAGKLQKEMQNKSFNGKPCGK